MTFSTFTGLEYLKIDIASSFGLDKEDWDARINWVDGNETYLESFLQEAEEPALYYAAVKAYRLTQEGKPTGHMISLDAAASGLQLLSCLAGCRQSAALCGVVPTGHRADAYTILYRAIREILERGDYSEQPNDHVKLPGTEITRADCKQAIMTAFYGSTAEPEKVFGKGEQLRIFYHVMETMAPGAWEVNMGLQALWQPYALSHDWIMPDNFHVHVKVKSKKTEFVQFLDAPIAVYLNENKGTKEGKSLGPNIVHSIDGMIVREMHRRCSFDPERQMELLRKVSRVSRVPKFYAHSTSTGRECDTMVQRLWDLYKSSGFLSSRILDYLDEANFGLVDHQVIGKLLLSMPEKPFPIVSIHDCFRCHPNYGNDLRRQYNQLLSEIAGSEMLYFIAMQVLKNPSITIRKMGDISKDILATDYALC